jgi:prolipoprotein diacylglyceryltransferase
MSAVLDLAFIPSPPANGVHIGPLFVHAYGIAYVVAIWAAIVVTRRRWLAVGGEPRLVEEVALWGVPAGLIGGRLYFLATSWNEVPAYWWGPLAVWKGGLGIWGGIAGGVLGGLWVLHRRKANVPAFLNAVAPALLVALVTGSVAGAVIAARSGVAVARKTAIPFGPFLALGSVVALFAGDALLDGYLTLLT